MSEISEKELKKLNIDELTHLFVDNINEQNLKLIEGIEYLVDEKFEKFTENLNYVIETNTEVRIKKTFESKIFKSKLMFSKADRLKLFNKIICKHQNRVVLVNAVEQVHQTQGYITNKP